MADNNNQQEQETDSYLYEPFVAEDGILVPPPTRPMGPRRLARYRDDAAEYLRALKNGGPLPEEPVAFMGTLDDNLMGSESAAQVQQKLADLAAQGSMEATVPQESRQDTSQAAEQTAPSAEILGTAGEPAVTPDQETEATKPAAVVDADTYQPLTVTAPWAAQSKETTQVDKNETPAPAEAPEVSEAVHETYVEVIDPRLSSEPPAESTEGESLLDATQTPAVEEAETLAAAETDPADTIETPQPVSALSSQGLDLSPVASEYSEVRFDEEPEEYQYTGATQEAPYEGFDPEPATSSDPVAEAEEPEENDDFTSRSPFKTSEPTTPTPVVEPAAEQEERQDATPEPKPVTASVFSVAQLTQAGRTGMLSTHNAMSNPEETMRQVPYEYPDEHKGSMFWLWAVLIVIVIIMVGAYFFMNNG